MLLCGRYVKTQQFKAKTQHFLAKYQQDRRNITHLSNLLQMLAGAYTGAFKHSRALTFSYWRYQPLTNIKFRPFLQKAGILRDYQSPATCHEHW